MGKVILIPNHHCGKDWKGISLTKGMLGWNLSDQSDKKVKLPSAYINALKALLKLPFNSIFCLQVDTKNKELSYAHRSWGWIYFDKRCIAAFSHDTRYDNSPFYSLYSWPEIDGEDKYEIIDSWTVKKWQSFFIKRIKKDITNDLREAKKELDESEKEVKRIQEKYDAIMQAINGNSVL